MSKQNVILKITITEESVKVELNGKSSSMSAGLAMAMDGNKDLEEVISNALKAVKFRRRQREDSHGFINDLKTILKEAKEAKEAEDKAESLIKKMVPIKT